MRLYLTRHGETQYNVLGIYCGSTDIPLNEKGINQAHELAARLENMDFDAVISSPMLRARQTAEAVCSALNMRHKVYDEFAERNMGVYEGLTRDEVMERYPDLWNRQSLATLDDAPDGGETLREFCARVDGGMARLIQDYKGKRVLLVCHGFVSRAVNRFCRNLSFDEMSGFSLGNCEIAEYNNFC